MSRDATTESPDSRRGSRSIAVLFLLLALLGCFVLALLPEDHAIPLTSTGRWNVADPRAIAVDVAGFPAPFLHVRDSALEAKPKLFRVWSATGPQPLRAVSPEFDAPRHLSVVVNGNSRDLAGISRALIRCLNNGRELDLFLGDVNVNATEAILPVPAPWCTGKSRLEVVADGSVNLGIGDAYAISAISYQKTRMLGMLPYAALAFAVTACVLLLAGAFAYGRTSEALVLPIALLGLGAVALLFFFAAAAAGPIGVYVTGFAVLVLAGHALHRRRSEVAWAWRQLAPAVQAWALLSFAMLALLYIDDRGVGHWVANNRFWPSTWSSDNELPWLFAEGLMRGWPLAGLLGPDWSLSDRPPLMVGMHLAAAPLFDLMQSNNDGPYLRGHAYGVAALVFNATWALAIHWLATHVSRPTPPARILTLLAFLAIVPFMTFNTAYGWPKALSATFCLVAAGLVARAWRARALQPVELALVLALGGVGFLAHASAAFFLIPVGLMLLPLLRRRHLRGALVGLGFGLAALAAWSLYKSLVLPSADPLLKYALTGDFGFGRPDAGVASMLAERYGSMSFADWIAAKRAALIQAWAPHYGPYAAIMPNIEWGASWHDSLRALDFLVFGSGNAVVPLLALLGGGVLAWNASRRDLRAQLAPEAALATMAAASWVLMVLAFLAPTVLHHWPQAAVLALGYAAAQVSSHVAAPLWRAVFFAAATYFAVVWLISPLLGARTLDPAAAVMFLVACCLWIGSIRASASESPVPGDAARA